MKNQLTLRILLVLSLINAVGSAVSFSFMATLMPYFQNFYSLHSDMFPAEFLTVWNRIVEIPRPYFAAGAVLYILEIVGCILMWRLRSSGFHCYTLSQLLLLLLPLLSLGKGFIGLGDIMFSLLFVAIYYMKLKSLGVFSPETDTTSDADADNAGE